MIVIEMGFALFCFGIVIFAVGTGVFHMWNRYNQRLEDEDRWVAEARRRFHRDNEK